MSVKAQSETFHFQAEVKQLLHLVTHALYSNKEIFLRELISNASDAADKLRFAALSDSAVYENDSELKIWVDFDKAARTITIRDNGIGMNREEVIENLGTIAKSGTRKFIEALSADQAKDANLIGQFGVGFYSAFVVADEVEVKTRRAGMRPDEGVYWKTDGQGEFTVENIEKPDRGTEVILHIKADDEEFLDFWRLRGIITKYSDHVLFPIIMKKPAAPATEENKEAPTIEEETVNHAQALWTLPKNKIKDEEYQELYRHVSHDFEPPLLWSHNFVEGKLEYISLLFIPQRPPFDLWMRERQQGLKLYVKHVFIMDDTQQLLPNYLRFVKGIVDSNDLPLNVSREILQNNKVIETMRAGIVKRVLSMLESLSKDNAEKYASFWKEFGAVLKEGTAEDHANQETIAKLLRFSTTYTDIPEQNVSLEDYVSRMKSDQDKIYYLTAETFMAAKNSPLLEIFRKKGIEVLLLTDRVDEWLVMHLREFSGKSLQSVSKADLDIEKKENDGKDEKKQKETHDEFEVLIKKVKAYLGEKVKDVRLTYRLTDSPVCLVADENDMSSHMQRILQAAGQQVPVSKPILELNPEHPILQKLKSESQDNKIQEWADILFNQAQLAEGNSLEDPAGFVKQLNALLLQAL